MTLDQLAEVLDCGKSHLSNVENGKRGLSLEQIDKLVAKYSVDARWFFGQLSHIEEAFGDTPTTETMIRELKSIKDKVTPLKDMDPVLEKVNANADLHNLCDMVKNYDSSVIRELQAMCYGYLARRDQEPKRERSRQDDLSEFCCSTASARRAAFYIIRKDSSN